MEERVFVTGGTGCLGANLIRRLVKEGYRVNALIYPGTSHPYLNGLDINRIEGDILDKDSLRKAMKGCSIVFHVAGLVSYNKKDFNKLMRIHAEGTRNIMELSLELGIKKVIHTSSTAAIGLPKTPDTAEDEKTEWNDKFNSIGYMYSKKLAEKESLKAHEKGLNVVIVQPTSFFGQGDINMNEGELIKNIKNGNMMFALPGGNSVVSVDDTVEGHLLAMNKGRSGESYILSNEFLLFIELFNVIAEELGVEKIKIVLPRFTFYIVYPIACLIETFSGILNIKTKLTPQVVNFSFHFRYYKSDKARNELGWAPKQTFRESVRKAIEFYEENKLI